MPLTVKIAFDNFYARPVTCILIAAVWFYCTWMGLYLVLIDLPPVRVKNYSGVRNFMTLREWGVAYLVVSVIELSRIVVLKWAELEVGLHMLTMMILLLWAFGFFLGPISVAQPGFFFVFVVCAFTPFVTRIFRYVNEREANG